MLTLAHFLQDNSGYIYLDLEIRIELKDTKCIYSSVKSRQGKEN